MKIIKSIRQMQQWAEGQQWRDKTIGFVPTMGA
ncbi:MAG: pantoate--beta-alanine ligase, partial [Nitrospirae bacterium]|nr:pantoate--beta-alanine ligase [Nitrospirota bacterium]